VSSPPSIAAVDLFCGAGGLSLGLQKSGISISAGIDLDPACRYRNKMAALSDVALRFSAALEADGLI
jgi:hypothetical protein